MVWYALAGRRPQAEMYPVPSSDPSWVPGRTEEIIGTWLAKNPELRQQVVLATKVSGFNPNSETVGNRTVPPGPNADGRLDAKSIRQACEASLRRLQTEYIDLYQLHWYGYADLASVLSVTAAKAAR